MPHRVEPERIDVRHGGHLGPSGYVFELTGGALCLDLANTVDLRPGDPHELLSSVDEVLGWARQSRCLPPLVLKAIAGDVREHPRGAMQALKHIREAREALFEIFAAVADDRAVAESDLQKLNEECRRHLGHLELGRVGTSQFEWQWHRDGTPGLETLLGPVVWSAAQLLTSDLRRRVRRCAAPDCDWLFLDLSRNRSRRWCDMTVCGNRAKARRFYARSRQSR